MSRYGVGLTTLDAMLVQIAATGEDEADDTAIVDLIHKATDILHEKTGRVFLPVRDTLTFDARGDHIGARMLDLDVDLLDLVTLTNGDGTTIQSTQVALCPRRMYPKWRIELLRSAKITWTYDTDWQDAISIDGIWGFHEDYPHAWVDTQDSVQDSGGIDASTMTIKVSDAGGKDARYTTRFQVEHILKIEDECLRVVDINTTTNELTVLRGQLGTTAAAHAEDTPITRYAPMGNVEKACRDLTLWLYRNQPVSEEKISLFAGHAEYVKGNMPPVVMELISRYRRLSLPS